MTDMELKVTEIGRTTGYNTSARRYRAEVAMMGRNVVVATDRIETAILALFPNTSGIGRSFLHSLTNLGVVSVENRLNEYGKYNEWWTGAWEFDYETRGND